MLAIKNNLMAQSAARHLGKSYEHLSTSVERLSSGLRINSAKDDAAGLAVRELIRADVASLQQGSRNAADGISMLQAAEGALGEIDAILVRMRELAEQASTGTYSSTQKGIMQDEYDELATEITRIATTTDFNGINLLQGTGTVSITLGAGTATNQTIDIAKQALDANALNLDVRDSIAGLQEAVLFDGANAVTGAANGSADAWQIATGAATVTVTFDGDTHDFNLEYGGGNGTALSFNDIAAEWTVFSFDTTDGALRLTGRSAGDLSDLAIDVTTSGAGLGTVVWAGGNDAIAVSDASITDGTADQASVAVSLTSGTVAQGLIDTAIETKDSYRAKLGYWMNRLEYAGSVLDVQAENLMAAESRISDVDVASEMSMMTRNQVLAQAGISMLAQANSMPQMALQLLQ